MTRLVQPGRSTFWSAVANDHVCMLAQMTSAAFFTVPKRRGEKENLRMLLTGLQAVACCCLVGEALF